MQKLRDIFEVDRTGIEPPKANPAPAPRQLLRDQVVSAIRRAIVEGRIEPGAHLTERELCEAFDISRTVVREVIRMLAAERLVDVEPHRGLRIAVLSRRRIEEIYQIRIEIEALVVRSFVASATDADIVAAEAYGARVLAAGEAGDRVAMVERMTEFEQFMNRVADNEVAAEILQHLNARVSMVRLLAVREPGQLEIGLEGVRAIIAGIVARDAEAADRAVRVFVRRSGEAVLRHVARSQPVGADPPAPPV